MKYTGRSLDDDVEEERSRDGGHGDDSPHTRPQPATGCDARANDKRRQLRKETQMFNHQIAQVIHQERQREIEQREALRRDSRRDEPAPRPSSIRGPSATR